MSIDDDTARALSALNNAFYEANAPSFSQSRQSPWPGWERLAKLVAPLAHERRPLRVLDVACGNLRFERFLADALPDARFEVTALDSCDELVHVGDISMDVNYLRCDVVGSLIAREPLLPEGAHTPFDLAVSFGFMHHIPGAAYRASFLNELAACVKPGGMVAVSLWRFMDDAHLAAKAQADTARGLEEVGPLSLDEGDYLLGWNNLPGTFRYCHHFDEPEVESLMRIPAFARATLARYLADGRTGALNEYLVATGTLRSA